MTMTTTATTPAADPIAEAVGRIHHDHACPGPNVKIITGRRGDRLARCRECGRFRVIETAKIADPLDVPEPAPAPISPSRYLLACVRCETTIPLNRPAPRVPLCDACRY